MKKIIILMMISIMFLSCSNSSNSPYTEETCVEEPTELENNDKENKKKNDPTKTKDDEKLIENQNENNSDDNESIDDDKSDEIEDETETETEVKEYCFKTTINYDYYKNVENYTLIFDDYQSITYELPPTQIQDTGWYNHPKRKLIWNEIGYWFDDSHNTSYYCAIEVCPIDDDTISLEIIEDEHKYTHKRKYIEDVQFDDDGVRIYVNYYEMDWK